jgi:hypothetical protein
MHSSVALSKYIHSVASHHLPSLDLFYLPKLKLSNHYTVIPHCLAVTILLFVSLHLTTPAPQINELYSICPFGTG